MLQDPSLGRRARFIAASLSSRRLPAMIYKGKSCLDPFSRSSVVIKTNDPDFKIG